MAQPAWWGWGDPDHARRLPRTALALLRSEVGAAQGRRDPVALADVRLPAPELPASALEALRAAVGEQHVRSDHEARVRHAAGRGYVDLVRLRAGEPDGAPDAVVAPGSEDELRAVLDACAERRVAVVPFGGGTSVVGGVAPLRGECGAVIALDLARMGALRALDRRSLIASFEPGARGPAAEAELARAGLTLGHFPQSFEQITLGGAVATRSAGQASTGYGRIDALLRGARLLAPAGAIELAAQPASAAGPDLRELVAGSEGVLGVIARVDLQVAPAPAVRRYEGWLLSGFEAGCEALRALAQHGAAPDVARLSDEQETRFTLALAGDGLKGALGRAYMRARGGRLRVPGLEPAHADAGAGAAAGGGADGAPGCLLIVGWEGESEVVRRRREATRRLLRRAGGRALGAAPGRAWLHGRFAAPYLRDELLARGVMVETLETAATWSALPAVHEAVGTALAAHAPIVGCHVSHLYRTGASLYFTFFARQREGEEVAQWRAAKRAASDAILASGGTITHHHAVGVDHAPWLAREAGELGVAALRAAKERLDPQGIMNPGKLLAP